MSIAFVDPDTLEGGALDQWYRRSPQQIQWDRQQRDASSYSDWVASFRPDLAIVDAKGAIGSGSEKRADPTTLLQATPNTPSVTEYLQRLKAGLSPQPLVHPIYPDK